MAILERHPRADLLRYLDGVVEGEEKRALEEHLAGCTECREYLSFVGGFNQGLANLSKEEFTSDEPCLDSWTLVAYEAGKVDEETAKHVRAHLLFCDKCAKEFYGLRRVSREESWREFVERVKEFVIDLGKTYGPQALVGSIRILAEQPVTARGGGPPPAASKVLEVSVGENTYSIELTATEEGSVSCDIAGVRTPAKVPLGISIRSETGGELFSTQSDEFGNSHFVLPGVHDDLLLLALNLKGTEQQILFRVPEGQKPA